MVRVLLCDDDLSYQEILSYKIQKLFAESIGMECSLLHTDNLDDALRSIQAGDADVCFLDVMLRDVNAVDRLVSVQSDMRNMTCVVCCTT